jgi:hypothetical protein
MLNLEQYYGITGKKKETKSLTSLANMPSLEYQKNVMNISRA